MNSRKITDTDIADLKISTLPTRPTAPSAFGGKGYTAAEMKSAFDRLPLYIIERYNELIEDITAEGEGSVAEGIKTGITDTHTLGDMFEDIKNGNFIQYLESGGGPLGEYLLKLRSDIDKIAERLNLKL